MDNVTANVVVESVVVSLLDRSLFIIAARTIRTVGNFVRYGFAVSRIINNVGDVESVLDLLHVVANFRQFCGFRVGEFSLLTLRRINEVFGTSNEIVLALCKSLCLKHDILPPFTLLPKRLFSHFGYHVLISSVIIA